MFNLRRPPKARFSDNGFNSFGQILRILTKNRNLFFLFGQYFMQHFAEFLKPVWFRQETDKAKFIKM